jgi:cysteinyl-tRNA synthetase
VLRELVSKVNVYVTGRPRAQLDVTVVERATRWVGDMLRMFGLGEGAAAPGELGWGEPRAEGDVANVRQPRHKRYPVC